MRNSKISDQYLAGQINEEALTEKKLPGSEPKKHSKLKGAIIGGLIDGPLGSAVGVYIQAIRTKKKTAEYKLGLSRVQGNPEAYANVVSLIKNIQQKREQYAKAKESKDKVAVKRLYKEIVMAEKEKVGKVIAIGKKAAKTNESLKEDIADTLSIVAGIAIGTAAAAAYKKYKYIKAQKYFKIGRERVNANPKKYARVMQLSKALDALREKAIKTNEKGDVATAQRLMQDWVVNYNHFGEKLIEIGKEKV